MAAEPTDPDELIKGVRQVYVEVELQLLALIGARLQQGIDAPSWATRQLASVTALRAALDRAVKAAGPKGDQAIIDAVRTAYSQGVAVTGGFGGVDVPALEAFIATTVGARDTLAEGSVQIVSQATKAYREVVEEAAGRALGGAMTRRESAAFSLAKFAKRGIGQFTDDAGRRWELPAYAEMTARTITGQAAVQGQVDTLQQRGLDLVMVNDAPEECKLCRPFEGKVLSLKDTKPGRHTVDGNSFVVVATLREAKRRGLFHPNCRHRLLAFHPGRTRQPTNTEDPEGDKLRQQQRYRERRVRQLKREVEALRPLGNTEALKKARANLSAYQSSFKSWREDNGRKDLAYRTSLKRR